MNSRVVSDIAFISAVVCLTLWKHSLSYLKHRLYTLIESYPFIYENRFTFTRCIDVDFLSILFIIGLFSILKLDIGEKHTKYFTKLNTIELIFGWLACTANNCAISNIYSIFSIASLPLKRLEYMHAPLYIQYSLNLIYRFIVYTESVKTLYDKNNVMNLFTTTYVNICIRLIVYYITPYTPRNENGYKLIQDPMCSLFSVSLAFYITMAFVISPNALLSTLFIVAAFHMIYDHKLLISNKRYCSIGIVSTNSIIYDYALCGATLFITYKSYYFGSLKDFISNMIHYAKMIPDHYNPYYDFISFSMNSYVCICVYITTLYFLFKTYYVEKAVVVRAHKKYKAYNVSKYVLMHGIGSSVELTLGAFVILYPHYVRLTYLCAIIGLFINIPTGFVLTSTVYGVKHITVPGFAIFGIIRILECVRVLYVHHALYPNAWILLQVGTIVRLLGYFVLPFTSKYKERGNMFTEKMNYSTNILLSGYISAAYVYHPAWLVLSLLLYVPSQYKWPHTLSLNRRPHCE